MSISNLFDPTNKYSLYCDVLTATTINGGSVGGNCVNTCQNIGGGIEVFKQVSGVPGSKVAEFRTLLSGAGINLTQHANDILITNTGISSSELVYAAHPQLSTIIPNATSIYLCPFGNNMVSYINKGSFTTNVINNIGGSGVGGTAIVMPATGYYQINFNLTLECANDDQLRFNYFIETCANDGSGEQALFSGRDWVTVPPAHLAISPFITRSYSTIIDLSQGQNVIFKVFAEQVVNPSTMTVVGGTDVNYGIFTNVSFSYLSGH